MTEKLATGHHGQGHGSQGRASKRISLGFAGIGAGGGVVAAGGNGGGGVDGGTSESGMNGNAGLGVGSVGMAAGSTLVADERDEENGRKGKGVTSCIFRACY